MLVLDKGTFLGELSGFYPAGDFAASITAYYRDKPISIMHAHEESHISFILKGGHTEQRVKSTHELFPGDILFYHSEEAHLYRPMIFPAVSVNLEMANGFFKRFDISEQQMYLAVRSNPNARFLMMKVLKEVRLNDSLREMGLAALVLELTAGSIYGYSKRPPIWALRLRDLLNDEWDSNFSLEQLSAYVGVHPITISKHFRSIFSCTLSEYVRKIRIEKALLMLHRSTLTLTQIAFQCGFADQSHFIRIFKQLTGFLPKEYRRI
jgi:AraC family transcriptional regulator